MQSVIILIRLGFINFQKWMQIMLQPGLKAAQQALKIVRCYARPIIGQKEINNAAIRSTADNEHSVYLIQRKIMPINYYERI